MFKDLKIVVIDDEASVTGMINQLITAYEPGIEVIEAFTGKQGLELIGKEIPDLIILDIKLPDMSGCEVCRIIKNQDNLANIPIVVITGLSDHRDLKIKFLEMGADAFLNKPFDDSELIAQIRALLRLKQAEDQLRYERDILKNKVTIQSKELSEQEERWQVILDYIVGGIWDWDLEEDKIHISSQWKELLGYEDEEIDDELVFFFALIHPADKERFRKSISDYLNKIEPEFKSDVRLQCKEGTYRWFLYRGHALWDKEGKAIRLIGIHTDITDHKQQLMNLEKMALYDNLTRLPNRVLFYDFTEKMMAATQRISQKIGILFLDLDSFKVVNDSLGHQVGDKVLKDVAQRLKSLIRPMDVIARFGGDEFMLAINSIQSSDELNLIIQRLKKGITEPFNINNQEITIEFSLGFSIYPDDGDKIDTLLKIADQKMYEEKNAKRINGESR
ncbi:MAG: diguanylate cyclase [Candidatus Cloacimonetes bacterium]|nr:diguanylate cyclase [Candidatus Cloacimonadota bacterium]